MSAPTMTAAAVLRDAAQALRTGEIRWGRDFFINPGITTPIGARGSRCALGSVCWAVDPSDPDGDPRWVGGEPRSEARAVAKAAATALAQVLIDNGVPACVDEIGDLDVIETVGGWNDAEERTVHQVIAALEAAAAWADRSVTA